MPFATKPETVDVVIVGMGASGATAAKVLCEAGLQVVGLDRGPWLRPKEHYSGDEIKFLNRTYLTADPRLNPRTVRMDDSSQARETPFSMTPQMVGGGTNHWAGWLPRPRPSDFRMRSLHGDIEGANLADWPLSYDDLEPYLSKVERAFGCAGLDHADAFEPYRSTSYPSPPLPPTRFGKRFYKACEKLGINAMPIPQAMATTPSSAFNWTGFWNGYGDPTSSRSSTLTTFVPAAVATGKFELRPESYVRRVIVGRDGRASGVVYLDQEGREVQQDARSVVLCLGAIESARLLLLSESNQFPEGLANSSGQVGRNATFHEYLFAVGLFDDEEPIYGFPGTYISGGSFQFYETDESRGHIGGALIGASHMGQPVNFYRPGFPEWGIAAKDADRDFYNHAMKIGHTLHDMPVESNRVDLDPDVKDAWGMPVARITHKSHPNDLRLAKWQVDKNVEILEAAGAWKTIPVHLERGQASGNTFHQHGTIRMGTDPARTVLDKWCQAHDVPNLFVFDGASFPTATGVNPTLTIMANAWRCAEYLAHTHARGRS